MPTTPTNAERDELSPLDPAKMLPSSVGRPLPASFQRPQRTPARHERKSPLPEEWSDGARPLRQFFKQIEKLLEKNQ